MRGTNENDGDGNWREFGRPVVDAGVIFFICRLAWWIQVYRRYSTVQYSTVQSRSTNGGGYWSFSLFWERMARKKPLPGTYAKIKTIIFQIAIFPSKHNVLGLLG